MRAGTLPAEASTDRSEEMSPLRSAIPQTEARAQRFGGCDYDIEKTAGIVP